MADTELVTELRAFPHFRALPPDLMQALAAGARRARYGAGQVVFSEGEPARAFFCVLRGAVKVHRIAPDGREQVLHHIGPGATFAEAAVLSMRSFPAHAVAVGPETELIEIEAERFSRLFRSDPRLAAAMVGSLSAWLLRLAERVEELSVPGAAARLAHYLLRQPSRVEEGHVAIDLPMSKKELAAHLAITPETLSRLLRRWQDGGVLRSTGRRLEVLDEGRLASIGDGEERI